MGGSGHTLEKKVKLFEPISGPEGTGAPYTSTLYHHLNIWSGKLLPRNNFNKADLFSAKCERELIAIPPSVFRLLETPSNQTLRLRERRNLSL